MVTVANQMFSTTMADDDQEADGGDDGDEGDEDNFIDVGSDIDNANLARLSDYISLNYTSTLYKYTIQVH